MSSLMWQCKCGNGFFYINYGKKGMVDKYIFWGKCPRCGSTIRRCFWFYAEDYKRAWAMLKATNGVWSIQSRPLQAMADRQGKPDMVFIRRMTRALVRRGYAGVKIHRMLKRRTSVSEATIQSIRREYETYTFTLTDAPPFCYPKIILDAKDFRSVLHIPKGTISDLCLFCMLVCDRKGVRCKAVKGEAYNFKFVQLGEDLEI